jgi:hypothetical protein
LTIAAAQADAMVKRDEALVGKQAEIDKRAAEDQAEIDSRTKAWEAKQQEWMDAKVTRRGMSTMEIIGVVLAGLGQAIDKKDGPNPALNLVMGKIQQDVDDQLRERDELGKRAGALKGAVDYAREIASDRNAQRIAAMGMEAQRWGREIETIGQLTKNSIIRAQAVAQGAALRLKGGEMLMQAKQLDDAVVMDRARLAQQERDSRRSAGVQYARIAEDRRQADMSFAAKQMEIEEARAQRVASATTATDLEAAKREVPDLASKGGAYRARDEKSATEIAKIKAAVDTIADGNAELLRLRQEYGSEWAARQSGAHQKMQAILANNAAAYKQLHTLGAWDKGTEGLTKQAYGGDPMRDDFVTAAMGNIWKGDPSAGIQKFTDNAVAVLNNQARALRDPRGGEYVPWKPAPATYPKPITTKNDEKVQALLNEKTPQEIRASAEPSLIPDAMARSNEVFGGDRLETNAQKVAESAARAAQDPTGRVTKGQANAVATYVDQLRATDPAIATDARRSLVALATNEKKPQLAQYAIDALARSGDEAALAEIEAARTAGAKSERELEQRREPVAIAKSIASAAQPASVAGYAERALKGDRFAVSKLVEVITSPLNHTADEVRLAQEAYEQVVKRSRK